MLQWQQQLLLLSFCYTFRVITILSIIVILIIKTINNQDCYYNNNNKINLNTHITQNQKAKKLKKLGNKLKIYKVTLLSSFLRFLLLFLLCRKKLNKYINLKIILIRLLSHDIILLNNRPLYLHHIYNLKITIIYVIF